VDVCGLHKSIHRWLVRRNCSAALSVMIGRCGNTLWAGSQQDIMLVLSPMFGYHRGHRAGLRVPDRWAQVVYKGCDVYI
jgi:hypothetical protein